jgi:hypothetical protein
LNLNPKYFIRNPEVVFLTNPIIVRIYDGLTILEDFGGEGVIDVGITWLANSAGFVDFVRPILERRANAEEGSNNRPILAVFHMAPLMVRALGTGLSSRGYYL